MTRPIIHQIPVCPFSQRIEILLALKGLSDAVEFRLVDITKARDPKLLELSRGTTALPIMDTGGGRVLKESLVILRYVEETFGDTPIARSDPYERGIERLMITREGPFTTTGYLMVMNTDPKKREEKRQALLDQYAWLDDFLRHHNPSGTFLFDRFGFADLVYTPMFMRFWFLDYFEDFDLPESRDFERVRKWRDACIAHPAAQQVVYEEIVKLYYDYAVGVGNGALPKGRARSPFTFLPDWRDRPMPPKDKYDRIATDAELGLV